MRHLAALLAAFVVASGCLSPITDRLRASDVEEPVWNVGDWWRYAITSETIDLEGEVTIVVAEVRRDGYVLGIPADAEANAALLYHMPAIGPVGRDLSWQVHDAVFEPARWPLEDGARWDTTWVGRTVRLQATLNGTSWTIDNEGHEQDALMRYDLVYDPAVKNFRSFVRTGLDENARVRQSMQLQESGTGYNGTLRAPQFIEVAFLESRTSGFLEGRGPSAPNPSFVPPEGATTLLVGCLAGGAPGQYRAQLSSPEGVVCQLDETVQPGGNDFPLRTQVLEVVATNGTWTAQLFAGGSGDATVEVLAWRELNYTLGS